MDDKKHYLNHHSKLKTIYRTSLSNPGKLLKYKQYRNAYNTIKKFAKKDYYSKRLIDFRQITKKLWETLNHLCGKMKK